MNRGGGGGRAEGATRFEQLYKAISGLPINIVKADLHRSKVDHACVCVYIYWVTIYTFVEYFAYLVCWAASFS